MADASSASRWMSESFVPAGRRSSVPRRANNADTRPRFSVAPPSVTKYDCGHSSGADEVMRTRAFENTGGELAVSADAAGSDTSPQLMMRYGSHMSGASRERFGKPLMFCRFVKMTRPPARLAY